MKVTAEQLDATRPMKHIRYAMSWIVADFVNEAPPNAIAVEIGAGVGTGLACMVHACELAGRDDITIYSVDPFAGTARCGEQTRAVKDARRHGDWALFLDMMQRHAPAALRRVHILRCKSDAAWWMFHEAKESPKYDLVIVDGDHSYEAVREDLLWALHIPRGGVIAGDDMVAGSDVERAVLEQFHNDVERRGNPHSTGDQHDWPTWRKRL